MTLRESDHSDASDAALAAPLEQHRALVRQVDRKFSAVYGIGGASALAATVTTFVVLRFVVGMTGVLPWLLAVTALLLSMFGLRLAVRRRKQSLRTQVEGYYSLNGLDREAMRDYYAADGMYPYFVSLFDDRSPDRNAP